MKHGLRGRRRPVDLSGRRCQGHGMTLPEHVDVHETLRAARDLLLQHRDDYESAVAAWTPPRLTHVNWALDWFDVVAARPDTAARSALWVVAEDGSSTKVSYEEM